MKNKRARVLLSAFQNKNNQKLFSDLKKSAFVMSQKKEKEMAYQYEDIFPHLNYLLYCENQNCPEKKLQKIIFFVGRKQMDIRGLDKKNCRRLFDKKFISDLPDLYKLSEKKEDLLLIEGFAEKSVENMLMNIELSKKKPFSKVLESLGFSEIGPATINLLIKKGHSSLEKLSLLANKDDALSKLCEIEGIAAITARQIIRVFKNKENINLMDELKKSGLSFIENQVEKKLGLETEMFLGQTWTVTGTFDKFQPRERAMHTIKKNGGEISASNNVTKKTSHLLLGRSPGSKFQKARERKINIVDELAFLKLFEK